VLADHLHALSGGSVIAPDLRGLPWPGTQRLRDGLDSWRRRVSQWLCGMHGHERHLHGSAGQLTLRCAFCGHEAPGWDIGAPRFARRLEGDPDRHRLARGSQQPMRMGSAAGESVASARVRAARAAIAQERQAPGGATPPPRRESTSEADRTQRPVPPMPRPDPPPEEGPVSDRSMVLGTLVVGAVVGSVVGYLLLTDDGRKSMDRLEHWVEDMLREADRLSRMAARTGHAANQLMEEWKNVQGSMGGGTQVRH
jgi:hypothetical protein